MHAFNPSTLAVAEFQASQGYRESLSQKTSKAGTAADRWHRPANSSTQEVEGSRLGFSVIFRTHPVSRSVCRIRDSNIKCTADTARGATPQQSYTFVSVCPALLTRWFPGRFWQETAALDLHLYYARTLELLHRSLQGLTYIVTAFYIKRSQKAKQFIWESLYLQN